MTTKLTHAMRSAIVRAAVAAVYDPQHATLTVAENALALEAYYSVVARDKIEALQRAAHATGLTFLALSKKVQVKIPASRTGWDYRYLVSAEYLPHPSMESIIFRADLEAGPLAISILAHFERKDGIVEEQEKFTADLRIQLAPFRTLERLAEAWPEGAPYYAQCRPEAPTANLPAPSFDDINARLPVSQRAA